MSEPNPFDEEPTKPRSGKGGKATSGNTAMKHARAILAWLEPGQPEALEAGKRVFWIYNEKTGERIPRTAAEDLYGVFDLVSVGFGIRGRCVQVTTQQERGQSVTARKRKIEGWIEKHTTVQRSSSLAPTIELWSWVRRKHMRRWLWEPPAGHGEPLRVGWSETAPLESPLLAAKSDSCQSR